jgi:RNA polymerase sigma-70 factor (ECF subfamily)
MDQIAPDSAETLRLLDRHAGGDAAALPALVRRHRSEVRQVVRRRLGRRLKPRVDPSDVVQETLLDVHRRLDDFLRRRPMPFRLWLLKTTHQRLGKVERRHVSAARRSVDREMPLPERSSLFLAKRLIAPVVSPSAALERGEMAGQVRRLLAELSAPDRELILLRNFDGLSNAEAACVVGIKPEAAKKRYARALLRLQRLVLERFPKGIDP